MPKQNLSNEYRQALGNRQPNAQPAESFHLRKPSQAPQSPTVSMKTNSRNQYRGHGRGQ